jgi:hypothetical protein
MKTPEWQVGSKEWGNMQECEFGQSPAIQNFNWVPPTCRPGVSDSNTLSLDADSDGICRTGETLNEKTVNEIQIVSDNGTEGSVIYRQTNLRLALANFGRLQVSVLLGCDSAFLGNLFLTFCKILHFFKCWVLRAV